MWTENVFLFSENIPFIHKNELETVEHYKYCMQLTYGKEEMDDLEVSLLAGDTQRRLPVLVSHVHVLREPGPD